MKKTIDSTKQQWCTCTFCDEGFFVNDDEKEMRCPHCGNAEADSFILETDADDERRNDAISA